MPGNCKKLDEQMKAFEQKSTGMCGPAALRTLLSRFNVKKTEEELATMCKTSKRYGTSPAMLVRALKKLGFEVVIGRDDECGRKLRERIARAAKKLRVNQCRLERTLRRFGLDIVLNGHAIDDLREKHWEKLNYWVNEMGFPVLVDFFSVLDGHYAVIMKLTKKYIWLADSEYHRKKDRKRRLRWNDFFRIWFDFEGDYISVVSDMQLRSWIVAYKKHLDEK